VLSADRLTSQRGRRRRDLLEALAGLERRTDDRWARDALRDHIAMPRVDAVLAWRAGGAPASWYSSSDSGGITWKRASGSL
jgi:hypothetical protein